MDSSLATKQPTVADNRFILQAELCGALNEYPYSTTITKLAALQSSDVQSSGLRRTSDLAMELKTRIGMIMAKGDEETRRKLIDTVQGGSTRASTLGIEVDRTMPLGSRSVSEEPLPLYTMRLKERADQQRKSIDYSFKQLSVLPANWEASVLVEDRRFTAVAETKRQAKHIASRAACIALGIGV